MPWNWELPDWPNFSWNPARLRKAEAQFLLGAGSIAGAVKHLPLADRDQIAIEVLSTEALTTSEIEGEILDRASVQSSIRRHFGLAEPKGRVAPAEEGIAEIMVAVQRTYAEPLSSGSLFAWHSLLFQRRGGLLDVGCYRTGLAPMQVVSGAIHAPRIHFEAPPSSRVSREMQRFVTWFNRSAPDGSNPLPALTRAGIAHLYFESIHPFEDGNGRLGRAIAEKAFSQCLGNATVIALAATILVRRKAYYRALEAANKALEVTDWLAWFAGIAIEAQRRTAGLVDFLLDKTRLLDRLRGQLNPRQEKALLRMFREGPEGFKGGLSAGNYTKITRASPATATRDLADLVAKGALIRSGELRHARYHLTVRLKNVGPVPIDKHGDFH